MGGFIGEDVGAASSRHCGIEGSLGTDSLLSLQTNAVVLWGALQGCCISPDAQFIWGVRNGKSVLPHCSVCHSMFCCKEST